MKVAINGELNSKMHSTWWGYAWIEYCKKNNIEYEVFNVYKCDAIQKLKRFDILLCPFGQYNHVDMLEARSILYSAKKMGLKVFPDFNEAWHFDDKVAEMYILQAIGAPIPDSKVYYNMDRLKADLAAGLMEFPIVGKLRTGSGSHNVKLLKSKHELNRYASRMFSRGYNPAPSLIYKTTSNIRSSHNKAQFMSKLKRVPEFLRTLSGARRFPHEKDYVYLQQFIQNDGYDMKVVVVGDKCAFLVRPIRSHDFRASGGGEVLFDKKYFKKQIIESAFKTSDALGVQCMGYDYVVNNETGEGVIVEMSYGFSHQAIMASGGYYDRNFEWHDEPLNAPEEVLRNLLKIVL